MRRGRCWLLTSALAIACSSSAPAAAPAPECAVDTDCVVVSVACAGDHAVPRAREAAERAAMEHSVEDERCAPNPAMPPRIQSGTCEAGRCAPDEVWWPELRACTSDEDCVAIDDPCVGRIAVARAREQEASASFAASDEVCRARRRLWGEPLPGDPPSAPAAPRCVRAYCRP